MKTNPQSFVDGKAGGCFRKGANEVQVQEAKRLKEVTSKADGTAEVWDPGQRWPLPTKPFMSLCYQD